MGFNCLINKQDMRWVKKDPAMGQKRPTGWRGTDSVPGTARDGASSERTPLGSPGRPPRPHGAASASTIPN